MVVSPLWSHSARIECTYVCWFSFVYCIAREQAARWEKYLVSRVMVILVAPFFVSLWAIKRECCTFIALSLSLFFFLSRIFALDSHMQIFLLFFCRAYKRANLGVIAGVMNQFLWARFISEKKHSIRYKVSFGCLYFVLLSFARSFLFFFFSFTMWITSVSDNTVKIFWAE